MTFSIVLHRDDFPLGGEPPIPSKLMSASPRLDKLCLHPFPFALAKRLRRITSPHIEASPTDVADQRCSQLLYLVE
jgi:hypothetical protein